MIYLVSFILGLVLSLFIFALSIDSFFRMEREEMITALVLLVTGSTLLIRLLLYLIYKWLRSGKYSYHNSVSDLSELTDVQLKERYLRSKFHPEFKKVDFPKFEEEMKRRGLL